MFYQIRLKRKYPVSKTDVIIFCFRREIYHTQVTLHRSLLCDVSAELIPIRLKGTFTPELYLTLDHLNERQFEIVTERLKQYAQII